MSVARGNHQLLWLRKYIYISTFGILISESSIELVTTNQNKIKQDRKAEMFSFSFEPLSSLPTLPMS